MPHIIHVVKVISVGLIGNKRGPKDSLEVGNLRTAHICRGDKAFTSVGSVRVGQVVQARKQDVRHGGHGSLHIEAGRLDRIV